MKKTLSFLSLLLASLILFASCNSVNVPQPENPQQTTPEVTTPEVTTPEVTDPEKNPHINPFFQPRKILAIGNSFSDDAMEHLAEILVGEGYTDFVLGNLYIGGCSKFWRRLLHLSR